MVTVVTISVVELWCCLLFGTTFGLTPPGPKKNKKKKKKNPILIFKNFFFNHTNNKKYAFKNLFNSLVVVCLGRRGGEREGGRERHRERERDGTKSMIDKRAEGKKSTETRKKELHFVLCLMFLSLSLS